MKTIYILIAFMLIGYSSLHFSSMRSLAKAEKLFPYTDAKDIPPDIIVANRVLGGFRGLMIDYLWMRSEELKEEGKFFELAQLYDLISKLESRLSSIWTYSAWNMAYNISKEVPDLEQRWEWVIGGVNLLRHNGLRYCARNYKIYEQLSWMLFHKIGGTTDESNRFYKEEFAREMEFVLGRNFDIDKYLAFNESLETLLKNEQIKKLYEDCFKDESKRDLYFKIQAGIVKEKDWYTQLQENIDVEAVQKLEIYYRIKLLKDVAALDLPMMKEVEVLYGKCNWRSASVHALYWINLAKKEVEQDHISINRLETYALKDIFYLGSLYPYTNEGGYRYFEFGPDFSKSEVVHRRFIDYMKQYEYNLSTSTFYYAYRHFLETISVEMYLRGDVAKAKKIFIEGFPYVKHLASYESYEQFVREAIEKKFEQADEQERAMMIFAPIEQYYMNKLILGQDEDEDSYFNSFVIKNWELWKMKRSKTSLPIPETLDKVKIMVLQMLKQKHEGSGLNKSYLEKFDAEIKRIENLEVEKTTPKK